MSPALVAIVTETVPVEVAVAGGGSTSFAAEPPSTYSHGVPVDELADGLVSGPGSVAVPGSESDPEHPARATAAASVRPARPAR
jgi:hypothetical protein